MIYGMPYANPYAFGGYGQNPYMALFQALSQQGGMPGMPPGGMGGQMPQMSPNQLLALQYGGGRGFTSATSPLSGYRGPDGQPQTPPPMPRQPGQGFGTQPGANGPAGWMPQGSLAGMAPPPGGGYAGGNPANFDAYRRAAAAPPGGPMGSPQTMQVAPPPMSSIPFMPPPTPMGAMGFPAPQTASWSSQGPQAQRRPWNPVMSEGYSGAPQVRFAQYQGRPGTF